MENNKFILFFVFVAIGFFAANIAIAHEYNNTAQNVVNTTEVTNITEVTKITNIYQKSGIASGISAAQCQLDGGSYDLQLCGGYGRHAGRNAYTVGVGQKIGNFLFNFTETIESGKSSQGFGVNWKVKFK